jgi:tetratricopeptide (TPR) repeat protein
LFEELMALKIVSFLNLVVCKHKLKEWQSIVGITDQVLEMDSSNVKCLYFRGNALLEMKEFEKSAECLAKLVHVDP